MAERALAEKEQKGFAIAMILSLILSFGVIFQGLTSGADTLSTERRNQQNVLLNASSDSQPRTISLGIPQWGTPILEDGVPTAMFSDFFPGFWYWRSGLSTASLQLTQLDESAILLGSSGFFPSSLSKVNSSSFEASVLYTLNHFGRNQIDIDLATPLGRGWALDLSLYQDLNPGSNKLDMAPLQERIQYYKLAVSKGLNGDTGRFFTTFLYNDRFSVSDPYGPFIFVGDGTVRPYGDFKLGVDQYLPETSTFDYIDVMTGNPGTKRFVADGGIPSFVLTTGLDYSFPEGRSLEIRSRLRLSGCHLTESMLGSIEHVTDLNNYTRRDHTPYSGDVQTRFMLYYEDVCNEWFNTVKYKGRDWFVGANAWFNCTSDHLMTTNFAYEAKKDPAHLLYAGQLYYVPNTGAQFFEGGQDRVAIFGQYRWHLGDKLSLRTGLRLEYSSIHGEGAYNLDGKENNTRCEGWSLQRPGVTRTPIFVPHLNGAATLVADYRFNDRWRLEADFIATRQHAECWQYGEAELPPDDPKDNLLIRGGFNYRNAWLDIQSLLTYYRQDNNYYSALWTHTLETPAGGYPAGYNESIYVGSRYSMLVLGWTTDLIATLPGGFSFHGLFTLRSPRYSDYHFRPVFSDGFSEDYDFSGRLITGTPPVEMELEPSWSDGRWRVWMSARYYGKQYVNLTNSLFFKPRWETFGGIDFHWNEHISISLDVVNFLNQKGASAGIQAASLAEDPSPFKNYLTSGTYLRPFTLEMSLKLSL